MDTLKSVEYDLQEMKAATLYKYGKKLEMAEEMSKQKLKLKTRAEKILSRLENETIIKSGFRKVKRQAELTERVRNKVKRLERDLKKLNELKEKYLADFKVQREFCGLNDHKFIDNFYKK